MIEKYSLQRQAEASPTCIEMYNLFSSYYFVKITYFANEKVEKTGNNMRTSTAMTMTQVLNICHGQSLSSSSTAATMTRTHLETTMSIVKW